MSMSTIRICIDDLGHITKPALIRFAEAWMAARGDADMPARSDFDPIAIPELLDRVWMCAYEKDEKRFVYRLAGEAINSVYGRSLRGVNLEDIIPEASYPIVWERYFSAIEEPAAVHTTGRIYLYSDRFEKGQRLILPLADENGEAAYVIGVTVFETDWDHPPREQMALDYHTTVTPVSRPAK